MDNKSSCKQTGEASTEQQNTGSKRHKPKTAKSSGHALPRPAAQSRATLHQLPAEVKVEPNLHRPSTGRAAPTVGAENVAQLFAFLDARNHTAVRKVTPATAGISSFTAPQVKREPITIGAAPSTALDSCVPATVTRFKCEKPRLQTNSKTRPAQEEFSSEESQDGNKDPVYEKTLQGIRMRENSTGINTISRRPPVTLPTKAERLQRANEIQFYYNDIAMVRESTRNVPLSGPASFNCEDELTVSSVTDSEQRPRSWPSCESPEEPGPLRQRSRSQGLKRPMVTLGKETFKLVRPKRMRPSREITVRGASYLDSASPISEALLDPPNAAPLPELSLFSGSEFNSTQSSGVYPVPGAEISTDSEVSSRAVTVILPAVEEAVGVDHRPPLIELSDTETASGAGNTASASTHAEIRKPAATRKRPRGSSISKSSFLFSLFIVWGLHTLLHWQAYCTLILCCRQHEEEVESEA